MSGESDRADRIERYFAGDLDHVERARLERDLETDELLAAALDEAYDRATEERGLLALQAPAPAYRECFSDGTLSALAAGSLTAEERGWVEAHLSCALCRERLAALEAAPGEDATPDDPPAETAGQVVVGPWRRALAWTAPLAAAAAVVAVAMTPPERPAATRGAILEALTHEARLDVRLRGAETDAVYFGVLKLSDDGDATWLWPTPSPSARLAPLGDDGAKVPIQVKTDDATCVVAMDQARPLERVRQVVTSCAADRVTEFGNALTAEVWLARPRSP